MQNRLLAYGEDGSSEKLNSAKLGILPTAINMTREGGMLLELADGTVAQLGRDFSIGKVVLAPQARSARDLRVGSLYQWELAGNELVAYGALLDEKDSVWRGFFHIPVGLGLQKPEVLMPLSSGDVYLIGNNYLAAIGSTAYYVAMDKSSAIFEVLPEHPPKMLSAFPKEFRAAPVFRTRMRGPRDAEARYNEIEGFSMVSGLYSQGEALYLLARKPQLGGRTEWSLYKIDPAKDVILAKIILPTKAHHLSVAVSRDRWFLVQRGAVREGQRQDIDSMIVIAASDISAAREFGSCLSAPASDKAGVRSFSVQSIYAIAAMVLGAVVARLIWELRKKIGSAK
jgi:hypothetical protein